jgi:shikimate kinase
LPRRDPLYPVFDYLKNRLTGMSVNLILCCFQGVGKTYQGKKLAEKLQRPFFDVDEVLLQGYSGSIKDLYKELGEDYFRDLEQAAVKNICQNNQCVIALGGGSLEREKNQHIVKESGILVYLYKSFEDLQITIGDIQPSYLNGRSFEELFANRHAVFSRLADITVPVCENVWEVMDLEQFLK